MDSISIIIKIFGQEVAEYVTNEGCKCISPVKLDWSITICFIVLVVCVTIVFVYRQKKQIHDSDLKSYEKYRDILNKLK